MTPAILAGAGLGVAILIILAGSLLFREPLRWLSGPRAKFCASLFCTQAPNYSVHTHQRQPASRYCFRHAIYQRAMMVLDGDTGSEVLDVMLDNAAQRAERAERDGRQLADRIAPSSIDLPTWARR